MKQDTHDLVTISGHPGSGTSTLRKQLTAQFDCDCVNGGDMFRRVAKERGVPLEQMAGLAEDDPSIDRELDEKLSALMSEHLRGERASETTLLVVESRLSGRLSPRDALSIWLKAPLSIRTRRTTSRDETATQLETRQENDRQRYQELYDIDIENLSAYDLIIDTSVFSSQETSLIGQNAIRSFLNETGE